MRGFSKPLKLIENAETIAIGDPSIIGTVTIKPDLLMINGQNTGATSLTVFGKSGAIYEYRVQVGNDIAQLKTLIESVEKKITIEDVNGTIVLKGEVATPAALARVLSIADRFASGNGEPDFSVISDKGGVLSGNLDEKTIVTAPEQNITVQSVATGGGGGGSGNATNAIRQPIMAPKGNLAQNISRGGVIMVAKGRVMSLIKVAVQPKVEIQMRVVAVDRKKTDDFGIDWRLDGSNITIGSLHGKVTSTLPAPGSTGSINAGVANLVGLFEPGKYLLSTFLKAVEEKGAAKTLSEPLVTAISGESASFLVGGNIPIPVQTLSAGNATSNATVTTNVQYIQFGLRLIVRPTVLENGKISIVLDQSITEPDYTDAIQILGAPIPGFSQRSVSTVTESDSGETWAVAGLLTEKDTKNLSSVPWISKVPVIGLLFQNKNDVTARNELMILVNARRVDGVNETSHNFDKSGDLSPTQPMLDVEDDEFLTESSQTPVKPEKEKEPIVSNKKTKNSRAITEPSMINNSMVKMVVPAKKMIKPNPSNN